MIVYSKSTGFNNSAIGKLETPIKMIIEHESDLLTKKGGICSWLFNVEKSSRFGETIVSQNEFDVFKAANEGSGAELDTVKETYTKFIEHIQFMKKLFGINSPSKVTTYMGEMLDEDLAVGIEDNADTPKKAMGKLSSDVIDAAGRVDGLSIDRHISQSVSVSNAAAASQSAGMLSKLDAIYKAIKEGQIIALDSDALVGGTANKMNTALGQRRVLAGRGAI